MINSRSHKYRRPVADHCIPRKALLALLDKDSEAPVTAILAPPGYGKTTLVSNYVESSEKLSIWYCVDEGDADLGSFFSNFSHAVRKATPNRRRPIIDFRAVDATNIKAFARRYFAAVYLRLEKPFAIVFDDVHECLSAQWTDVIQVAADELPETGRVILISRQALAAEFARFNLNQKIRYIRETDLRFSDEELKSLALRHNIDVSSNEIVNEIQLMMAGWVAGLALLFMRMKHVDQSTLLSIDSQDDLFKYFTNEVLRCVDEDVRHILYRTCFLPDVSVEHAITLTNNPVAGAVLHDLYNKNYFIYRVTDVDAGLVYRYHPLFKSFLISQSESELSVDSFHETQAMTVTLLEKDGAIVAAASLLIKMGDWQRLIEFVQQYAKALVSENCIATLSAWLDAIPKSEIERSGWLLYWSAVCALSVHPKDARQGFIRAVESFQHTPDLAGKCLSLSGVINSYIVERDDFKPLDKWIEQVDKLAPALDETVSVEVRAILTESMFSALQHRAPHHLNYIVWLDRLKNVSMSELSPDLRAKKLISILLHYLWQGDYHYAEINHAALSQEIGQSTEIESRILWHLIHCCFLWMTGDSRNALGVAKAGLALAKEHGALLWNVPMLSSATAAALMINKNDEAADLLRMTSSYLDNLGCSHLSFYHVLYAIHAYRNDDVDVANCYAQEARRYADVAGSPFYQAHAYFLLAQLSFLRGDIDDARQHVLKTKTLAKQMCSYFHEFHSGLLGAIIGWYADEKESALAELKNCLSLGRKYNLLPGLWPCDEAMAELFAEAIRNNIESDYVCNIIVKRNMILTVAPYEIEAWPWPIRIFTLGRFDILIDGQSLTLPSRNRPKVFSLLKVLIAFGGKKVREELITEVVWPDAEGDVAHQSYTTTLFRLRKMLGHHEALINREGRLSLNEKFCWLDTWAFSENSEKLISLLNSKKPDVERITLYYDQLSNYYRGDFFQSEESLLVVEYQQQKIRAKWINNLFLLTNYWLKENSVAEADSCIDSILGINPLEERAYRTRINLYLSEGRLSEAAITYEVCKKSLKLGLNVVPSAETEMAYKKIQGAARL